MTGPRGTLHARLESGRGESAVVVVVVVAENGPLCSVGERRGLGWGDGGGLGSKRALALDWGAEGAWVG